MLAYVQSTMKDFGLFATLMAAIPFGFLFRVETTVRRWMVGLLSVFVSLSFLKVALLNPPIDRQAAMLVAEYFTASHLVLAVLFGYGILLLGTKLSQPHE